MAIKDVIKTFDSALTNPNFDNTSVIIAEISDNTTDKHQFLLLILQHRHTNIYNNRRHLQNLLSHNKAFVFVMFAFHTRLPSGWQGLN